MKSLCQKLKWYLPLFVLLLLGGFGFGIHKVKAEINYTSLEKNGSSIIIPEYEGDALVYYTVYENNAWGSWSLTGSNEVTLNSQDIIDPYSPYSFKWSIVVNPQTGTNSVGGNYSQYRNYFMISGLDLTSLPSATQLNTYSGSNPFNIILNSSSDITILVGSIRGGGGGYDTSISNENFSTVSEQTYGGYKQYVSIATTEIENDYYAFSATNYGVDAAYSYFWQINLSTYQSEPEPEIIANSENTYLIFNPELKACPINTSCLLNYSYDTSIFSAKNDFLKVWYYETSTSTPEYLGVQPLSSRWEFDVLGSGYLIASSTATTSRFSYYIVQPCKMSEPLCAGTSSVAFFFTEQTNPIDLIELITATGTNIINNNTPSLIAINSRNLACSEEEWASENWWTNLSCNTKAAVISIPISVGNAFSGFFNKTWNYLKNIFPFGVIKNILNAWENADMINSPESLDWVVPTDQSGNFVLKVPAGLLKQATSAEVVVFGNGLAGGDSSWQEFTNNIQNLTTYLLWGGWLLGLYAFGKKVYNDLEE